MEGFVTVTSFFLLLRFFFSFLSLCNLLVWREGYLTQHQYVPVFFFFFCAKLVFLLSVTLMRIALFFFLTGFFFVYDGDYTDGGSLNEKG
jgi:hypothetical protein